MLYKNLTTKELYSSFSRVETIDTLFRIGLEENNERLAISAMEELIYRGATDLVTYGLDLAFERGDIATKTTMSSMIARSLRESCRGVDPFLYEFGKFLLKAEGPDPFKEWLGDDHSKGEVTIRASRVRKIQNPLAEP